MDKAMLYILWDESHIWGLLAAHAARSMGIPHRLARGSEIAAGLLRDHPPAMLLVPGGSARHKAEVLGQKGLAAIRDYVDTGGRYLGFCGGAGLALSEDGVRDAPGFCPDGSLGLCPWTRAGYDDRMQHFMSGHVYVSLPRIPGTGLVPSGFPERPLLPVWWPGRFAAQADNGISVLATYEAPGEDFWLADLPIASLPPDTFSAWHDLYGVRLSPTFLAGQPCLVHGAFGRGSYTLSYSHLETPESPHANHWLAHLLTRLGGIIPRRNDVSAWDLGCPTRSGEGGEEDRWKDAELLELRDSVNEVVRTGLEHGLLFQRNPWLLGWRTGIPGAALNNLRAALGAILSCEPAPEAGAYWKSRRAEIMRAADTFRNGGTSYLLAERLAMTLTKSLPDAVPVKLLQEQRNALFGPPMRAGGLYRDLILPLDELAFLQLRAQPG